MNCTTHHHACDCREALFTDLQKEVERLRDALEDAKEALMDGSGAGVFWRESAVERINKVLQAPRPAQAKEKESCNYERNTMDGNDNACGAVGDSDSVRGAALKASCSCEPESKYPCNQCIARGLNLLKEPQEREAMRADSIFPDCVCGLAFVSNVKGRIFCDKCGATPKEPQCSCDEKSEYPCNYCIARGLNLLKEPQEASIRLVESECTMCKRQMEITFWAPYCSVGCALDAKEAQKSPPSAPKENVESLYDILANAKEYLECIPSHLGDIQGNRHQVEHVEHFLRQAEAWVSKAIAGLDPGPVKDA